MQRTFRPSLRLLIVALACLIGVSSSASAQQAPSAPKNVRLVMGIAPEWDDDSDEDPGDDAFEIPPAAGDPGPIPAGSPLARRIHPRLYLLPDGYTGFGPKIGEVRARMQAHSGDVQTWLDVLHSRWSVAPASKSQAHVIWDGWNAALVALIDPATLTGRSFGGRTRQDYVAFARAHAINAAERFVRQGVHEGDTHSFTKGPATHMVACVYDWLAAIRPWGDTDKRFFAETAIIGRQLLKNYTGRPLASINIAKFQRGMLIAAALKGDGVTGTSPTTGEPYEAALDRLIADMRIRMAMDFFDQGNFWLMPMSGWNEGNFYMGSSSTKITWTVLAHSTLMGENFFATVPWLRHFPVLLMGRLQPHRYTDAAGWYEIRVDTGKPVTTDAGGSANMVRLLAWALKDADPALSRMSQWMNSHFDFRLTSRSQHILTRWMLFRFITPAPEDLPTTPLHPNSVVPRSVKTAFNEFYLRSQWGHQSGDAAIMFHASDRFYGGHGNARASMLTLDRFGSLLIKGGNPKSTQGMPRVSSGITEMSRIVYWRPGDSGSIGRRYQRDNSRDPRCAANTCTPTKLVVEAIAQDRFDYVAYEDTATWEADRGVAASRRDVAYLRPAGSGGHYVVVVDRVSLANPPAGARLFQNWRLGFLPDVLDNVFTSVKGPFSRHPDSNAGPHPAGEWTTTGRRFRMVNQHGGANGVLHMAVLWPTQHRVHRIGGDGWEFRDFTPERNEIKPSAGYNGWLTDKQADRVGRYRLEVHPATLQRDTLFLTVFQLGNAKTEATMTPTASLTSAGGTMIGAVIQDAAQARVLLVPANQQAATVTGTIVYDAPNGAHHLLTGVRPSTGYGISRSGSTVTLTPGGSTAVSTAQGLLQFVR